MKVLLSDFGVSPSAAGFARRRVYASASTSNHVAQIVDDARYTFSHLEELKLTTELTFY